MESVSHVASEDISCNDMFQQIFKDRLSALPKGFIREVNRASVEKRRAPCS
jgi:hypothetical protein